MTKVIKCPYCERLISEKTMKDHLNVNAFFCKLKHNNFMNNCSTMKDAFTSKMDKVADLMLKNLKGRQCGLTDTSFQLLKRLR